jgi:hypothetical protein
MPRIDTIDSTSILISTAMEVPSENLQALEDGSTITILPWNFLQIGQSFGLFSSTKNLPYFGSYWAKCRFCKSIDREELLQDLSRCTIWDEKELLVEFQKRGFIWLAFLQVYRSSQPFEIMDRKVGAFSPLKEAVSQSQSIPILSDTVFTKRYQRLDSLQPSLYPQLERLQVRVNQLLLTEPLAKNLAAEFDLFLFEDRTSEKPIDPDLEWISQIASVGNSSDGNEFEKLTRKALIKLGFSNSLNNPKASLDPEATGGAGGIDFYANYPYSIVGECKASKSVKINDNKDGAPIQLLKLGQKHLKPEEYDRSVKVILAAGDVTSYADNTSKSQKMNILRPETLQKLVELKAIHSGTINLWTLQECLKNGEFGIDADRKVNDYIEREWQQIELRSNLIETVRESQNIYKSDKVDISQILGSCRHSSYENIKSIEEKEILNLAMELASPLTGYLGRIVESGVDRFYFIRELPVREAKA